MMTMLLGLEAHDDPFAVLGVAPSASGAAMRSRLADLCGWYQPGLDVSEVEPGQMATYRRAIHSYVLLREPHIAGRVAAAVAEGVGIGGILERLPYPEVDWDWVEFALADAVSDLGELREDVTLGSGALERIADALSELPSHIDPVARGWGRGETPGLWLREMETEMRAQRRMPEICDLGLPEGLDAWRLIWRLTKWELKGEMRLAEVKAIPERTRALWQGRQRAPLWEVTVSLPGWLAMRAEERAHVVHEALVSCELGRTPTVKPPTLEAQGCTLARHGARSHAQALQILHAARHPRTRALVEEAMALGLTDPYEVREPEESAPVSDDAWAFGA